MARKACAEAASPTPWIGYDAMAVATIRRFVAKSTPTQARAVQDYEHAHLNRDTVIDAAVRRLDALPR